MKISLFLISVFIALTTLNAVAQPGKANQQVASTKKINKTLPVHKIVIQLSTSDTVEQKALMNNLKNLKEGWGDSVIIEVVIHGPGIDAVIKGKTTQHEGIQRMMTEGVHFVVCTNTMKQRNITEDQIISNVGFVPMGVGEIVLKQEHGWSYLKAGF